MRMENIFSLLRIWTMSMEGAFGMVGVEAPLGVTGTKGTVLNPGAGAVAGGESGVNAGYCGCCCGGDVSMNLRHERNIYIYIYIICKM